MKTKTPSIPIDEQLRKFLMSDKGFVTIEEARKEADEKWPEKSND